MTSDQPPPPARRRRAARASPAADHRPRGERAREPTGDRGCGRAASRAGGEGRRRAADSACSSHGGRFSGAQPQPTAAPIVLRNRPRRRRAWNPPGTEAASRIRRSISDESSGTAPPRVAWLPPGRPWPMLGAGAAGGDRRPRSRSGSPSLVTGRDTGASALDGAAGAVSSSSFARWPRARCRPASMPSAVDDLAGRLAKLEAAVATPRPAALDPALANRISAIEGQVKALGETVWHPRPPQRRGRRHRTRGAPARRGDRRRRWRSSPRRSRNRRGPRSSAASSTPWPIASPSWRSGRRPRAATVRAGSRLPPRRSGPRSSAALRSPPSSPR